jgi:hypothetical protein
LRIPSLSEETSFPWMVSSAPNCRVSIIGAHYDALMWSTVSRNLIVEWMTETGNTLGLKVLSFVLGWQGWSFLGQSTWIDKSGP